MTEIDFDLKPARYLRAVDAERWLGRPGCAYWCEWDHPAESSRTLTSIIEHLEQSNWPRFVRPGSVAIDIGGHSGDTAVPLGLFAYDRKKDRPGTIIVVEPNPDVLKIMEINLTLNRHIANFKIASCAITDRNIDQIELSDHNNSNCNGGIAVSASYSSELRSRLNQLSSKRYITRGVTLETLLSECGISDLPSVSFIKIDCEGFDKEILRSSADFLRKIKPVLYVEWFAWFTEEDDVDFLSVIDGLDYIIFEPISMTPLAGGQRLHDVLCIHKSQLDEETIVLARNMRRSSHIVKSEPNINREQVRWMYRALLGREPDSEALIDWYILTFADFETARLNLINSIEFQQKYLSDIRYLPDAVMSYHRDNRPKLALATIVKNEESYIALMLRSCAQIIHYAVIVDTGSTDATKIIADAVLRECGVPFSIVDVPFENFAQARNAALERVPRDIDWILMLDADEHIVPDDFHKWRDLMRHPVDVWTVPRFNFIDVAKEKAVTPYPDYQRRLLRNRPTSPLRYQGLVHEEVAPPFENATAPATTKHLGGSSGGPHIHHMGQADNNPERARLKHQLYTELTLQIKSNKKTGA